MSFAGRLRSGSGLIGDIKKPLDYWCPSYVSQQHFHALAALLCAGARGVSLGTFQPEVVQKIIVASSRRLAWCIFG
jgi:hypothetical protein